MPDKTPELLPCPFCGGSKLEIIRYWGGYRVMCWECKNESGFYSEDKAMDAWNRRAQPKFDCAPCELAERLAAYKVAEEQGRLVVLPCRVGDTVYIFCLPDCVGCADTETCTVQHGEKCHHWGIHAHEFRLSDLEYFGKTVFTTREEAEKALEGMK